MASGTITFLFTDIEGSTRLWEERGEEMSVALARHDALLRVAIDANGGAVFSTGGDGLAAAFQRAVGGITAALTAQRKLCDEGSLRVRMALHTGEAEERDGDYFGPVLNRCARLAAVAHGGQVLCSGVTAELVRDRLGDGQALRDLGQHHLRAVRLFVERAREANFGFALTPANAGALARLVRRLDGIPLAIELAAARVRSITPAELAERLDERFQLLGGGRRTAVERHQTLRRAIDWSYGLLGDLERLALIRASVFAGDFSLGSAEEVISDEQLDSFDVADLLGRLADKSLLLADVWGSVTIYRMLETIRQYAHEKLEAAGEAGHGSLASGRIVSQPQVQW